MNLQQMIRDQLTQSTLYYIKTCWHYLSQTAGVKHEQFWVTNTLNQP